MIAQSAHTIRRLGVWAIFTTAVLIQIRHGHAGEEEPGKPDYAKEEAERLAKPILIKKQGRPFEPKPRPNNPFAKLRADAEVESECQVYLVPTQSTRVVDHAGHVVRDKSSGICYIGPRMDHNVIIGERMVGLSLDITGLQYTDPRWIKSPKVASLQEARDQLEDGLTMARLQSTGSVWVPMDDLLHRLIFDQAPKLIVKSLKVNGQILTIKMGFARRKLVSEIELRINTSNVPWKVIGYSVKIREDLDEGELMMLEGAKEDAKAALKRLKERLRAPKAKLVPVN